ncbi:MAG: GIY-YIG nuclease family protein [Candidatus Omnitrophota bacterium]
MWYVYILECSDQTLYIGTTTSLTERLDKHNKGKASKYTRGRIPVALKYHEEHPDKTSALKRELQLKRWSKTKKLALVEGNKAKLIDLAKSHD